MDLTIESLRAEDEVHRHALARQAFGGSRPFDPGAPRTDPDRVVAAYDAGRLVGAVITFDFAQTWGGRPVPCGGVTSVAVAPEARGRGAARRMLAESFDRMARRGEVIAALYPTASALYRGSGFEVVAFFQRRSVPLTAVAAGREELAWRPVALDDPVKADLHDRAAAAHDGWFRGDPGWWAYRGRAAVQDETANRFAYVGSRDGADVAVVQFRYEASEAAMYDLDVEVIAGLDGTAVGAALGLLAAHGSTAGAIRTALPPVLLGPHVPELQRTRVVDDWPLMLRVVDAPAAIQARGWPRAVQGRVDLDIIDDAIPTNAGPHVLEVEAGEATLVRGGTGRVTVTAQDLAVLYAGGDVQSLRSSGRLVEATVDDLDLLAAACTSRPTVPLFF